MKKILHCNINLEYFQKFNFFKNFFSGIRRRENQREGFRRAMAEKDKHKKEFEEWHETTRAAEAEKTSKVSFHDVILLRDISALHNNCNANSC